jgi:hypothetical protein
MVKKTQNAKCATRKAIPLKFLHHFTTHTPPFIIIFQQRLQQFAHIATSQKTHNVLRNSRVTTSKVSQFCCSSYIYFLGFDW